jgi:hypothetical protein
MWNYIVKNKVFIIGLLVSIIAVAQQFLGTTTDWKVIAFAVGSAIASYFAKNLTGQWASIAAIAGSLIATISTQSATGHVSWLQIIIQAVVSVVGVLSGSATVQLAKKIN